MKITKDDYILRRLAKVSNKKWEFFVISRVIHMLDDQDIEFVTQQLVRRNEDGKRALTDMYFPQFNIHLEIDEGQHETELHAEADKKRTEDIRFVTKHEIHRIKVAKRIDEAGSSRVEDLSLETVIPKIDAFIQKIRNEKHNQVISGTFQPWDFDLRYDPIKHIENGYISSKDDVVFLYQKDALKCFGYTGGHFQRGAWRMPDSSGDLVWFPRLYKTKDWDNELSSNGEIIYERALNLKSQQTTSKNLEKNFDTGKRIVFARVKSPLGYILYRYVGTFLLNKQKSNEEIVQYDLVSFKESIRL